MTAFYAFSHRGRCAIAALVLLCLLGIQAAGLVHRIVHAPAAGAPSPAALQLLAAQAQSAAHDHAAHGGAWIIAFGHAACLHGDDCAAIDHLLLIVALLAASITLALLAARHALAARLTLARSCTRPRTRYARGPPR